jgi:uncharacterized protein (TIGR02118 family)
MIKLVYIVRARDDIAPEEFHRYWLEVHGPMVREAAKALRARKYIQSHTMATPVNDALIESRGMAPSYEGIAEAWWESLDELQAAVSEPEGADAIKMIGEDEAIFIDQSRSTMFVTEEHTIFDFAS